MTSGVQTANLIVTCLFLTASTTVVSLRLWDRRVNRRLSLVLDDYAIIVSLIAGFLWTLCDIVWLSHFFLGVSEDLHDHQYKVYLINSYVSRLFYAISFDTAKVAIILFYIKVTDRLTQRTYWMVLCSFLAFMIFDLLLHFFILAVPCVPVTDFWDRAEQNMATPNCISTTTAARVINAFTFTTEVFIVLAPIPMLWLAGLNRQKRIALACMFSLGGLIILASSLKLANVLKSSRQTVAYNYAIVNTWTAVEFNTALIVAGCLPLKALFEARFMAVKRRFSSPDTSKHMSQDSEPYRKGSLAPSDPYDLENICSAEEPVSPQSVTNTLCNIQEHDTIDLAIPKENLICEHKINERSPPCRR